MKISAKGLDELKESEGFRDVVYLDEAGLETIGYGHLLRPIEKETKAFELCITKERAEEILRDDLAFAETAVEDLVTVPLTQGQFDALVLFVFNVGVHAFSVSSLLRVLNRRAYNEVPDQLRRWNKVRVKGIPRVSRGLVRRREREIVLWEG